MANKFDLKKTTETYMKKCSDNGVPAIVMFVDGEHHVGGGFTEQTPVDSIIMMADAVIQLSRLLDVREHDLIKEIKRVVKFAKQNGVAGHVDGSDK